MHVSAFCSLESRSCEFSPSPVLSILSTLSLFSCLLPWVEDDQVGVVTTKSVKKGQQVYASAFADFKWGKKAKVLRVSGE